MTVMVVVRVSNMPMVIVTVAIVTVILLFSGRARLA